MERTNQTLNIANKTIANFVPEHDTYLDEIIFVSEDIKNNKCSSLSTSTINKQKLVDSSNWPFPALAADPVKQGYY